jgi:hypothetical protein
LDPSAAVRTDGSANDPKRQIVVADGARDSSGVPGGDE